MTRVGIAGAAGDPVVRALAPALRAAGAEPVVVDSITEGAPSLSFADGAFFVGGEPIDDVGAWYVRAVVLTLPAGGARIVPQPPPFAWFWAEHERIRGRQALALGFLAAAAERGVPVVNRVRVGSPEARKAYDLCVLARAGVPLPRTLVTSSPVEAGRFLDRVREAVVKPLQGRHQAIPVTPEVRARLARIRSAPAIFQERVRGDDIRVTVLGGEVISALRIESGQSEEVLDFRATDAFVRGAMRCARVRLPAAARRACLAAARALGYEFTGIDLKLGARGAFKLLEANASPLYIDFERRSGDPITARLAERLVRLAREARPEPRPRAAPLARGPAPAEPYADYFFDYIMPF